MRSAIAMPHAGHNRRIANLLGILMLLIPAFLGCGGSSSSTGVSLEQARDNALMENQELDLGPVLESQDSVKCFFRIVNTTKSSIRLEKLAPSCACSNVHVDKNELAPGEETNLRVEARVHGRAGKQRFTCRVDTDRASSFSCSVLATVYRPLEFEELHVSLGSLEHSKVCSFSKKLYVNTTQSEKERYQIASLASPQEDMDASLTLREERVIDKHILQKAYDVKVNLLPNATALPGKQNGSLILTYADQKGPGGAIVMQVSWMTPEHLQITPARIAFGSISDSNSDMQKDAILECSSASEPRFRILRTISSHPGLSVVSTKELSGAEGRRYRIRIALDPSRIDRFFSESITILTDHPLAPNIRLPVIAYKARPQQ